MAAGVVIDAALLIKALHVSEELDSHEFFVRKMRTEVTQALIFQIGLAIVSPADAQVESSELLLHRLNSTPFLPSVFLLLIRMINLQLVQHFL